VSAALLLACCAAAAVLSWPTRPLRSPPGRVPPRPGRDGSPDEGASAAQVPVAVVIELVAAALGCGLPPVEAVAAAVRAARGAAVTDLQPVVDALRLGASAEASWRRSGASYAPLARTLLLADRTGASAAAALRRAAVDERAARRRRASVAAHRLGVQLVLPLGLATLPSFVCLGVVPVVLGLAGQFLGS